MMFTHKCMSIKYSAWQHLQIYHCSIIHSFYRVAKLSYPLQKCAVTFTATFSPCVSPIITGKSKTNKREGRRGGERRKAGNRGIKFELNGTSTRRSAQFAIRHKGALPRAKMDTSVRRPSGRAGADGDASFPRTMAALSQRRIKSSPSR